MHIWLIVLCKQKKQSEDKLCQPNFRIKEKSSRMEYIT